MLEKMLRLISSKAFVIPTLFITTALLILVPIIFYLATIWRWRRERLFKSLTPRCLRQYYLLFFPEAVLPQDDYGISAQFKRDFGKHYGLRFYILPLLLLMGLTIVVDIASMGILLGWTPPVAIKPPVPNEEVPGVMMVAALWGSLVWIAHDELGRICKHNIAPVDILHYSLRIVVAIPFGWSFSKLFTEIAGVPLAFMLGAFPTTTLLKFARRLSERRFGVADDEKQRGGELERLQCVGSPAADRLREQGVESIADLAYRDPIELSIRTNFDLKYVIDCVSQALLWIYFGDETDLREKQLYKFAFRGAQEVVHIVEDHDNWHEQEEASTGALSPLSAGARRVHDDVEAAIKEAQKILLTPKIDAKVVQLPPAPQPEHAHAQSDGGESIPLLVTLRMVAADPFTKFICMLWKELHRGVAGDDNSHAGQQHKTASVGVVVAAIPVNVR